MATYNSSKYTAESRLSPPQPIGGGHGLQGQLYCKRAKVTNSAALLANDLLNFFYMPKGAVLQDIKLEASDQDTDGTPAITIHIGNTASLPTGAHAADDDRFIASSAVGQAGVTDKTLVVAAQGFTFTENTLIQGKVAVAPDAGQAGDVTLTMYYTMEDSAVSHA